MKLLIVPGPSPLYRLRTPPLSRTHSLHSPEYRLINTVSPLDLRLHVLERPHNPPSKSRCKTRHQEWTDDSRREQIGDVAAEGVNQDEVSAHESDSPAPGHPEARVDMAQLPNLLSLPAHFCVFQRSLDDRTSCRCQHTAHQDPQLEASSKRDLKPAKRVIQVSVDGFKDGKLARSEYSGTTQRR